MHMENEKAPRKLINVLRLQVRWADLDANRHVNNVTYFTYFEQARVDWLKRTGMQTTADGEGPVVVRTTCNYRRSIPYGDALDVRVYAGTPGRSSFPTYYEIVDVEDEAVVYADGEATMVWTNRTTGKSCPVPEAMRALLAA
jgi:acyl-CoA thioester hydrolase